MHSVRKRLLILGGTSASEGVVREARELGGVYIIVADDRKTGPAKEMADEAIEISTTNTEELAALVKEKGIDGVFCGPTEFNLMNVMRLCEAADLPFYASEQQWEQCSNKISFRKLCKKYGIPCAPEYGLSGEADSEEGILVEYPVIVKPVDGCSSKGVRICRNFDELKEAYDFALQYSALKKVIVEKYIVGDYGIVCRYIAIQGRIYLLAVNDNYTADTSNGEIMITAASVFPSRRIDEFITNIHPKIVNMARDIGIENGAFFIQARVDGETGNIYFHDMGFRLSGGQVYPIYKTIYGFSDMKMMIRFALGEPMASEDELLKIEPHFYGKVVGNLSIPLLPGVIGRIEGIEKIKKDEPVIDVLQYYHEGDEMTQEQTGTLMQLFCRIRFVVDSYEEAADKMEYYQSCLNVTDGDGRDLIYRRFDTRRLFPSV
ncbi:ATP-grasp domain-containing protein [Lachnospiraceae bacterium 62-26]